ncbi:MAG: hypothetical protein IPG74_15490 [Flavobacteriales bacterium]|nr:hypothetical protein [Flavobacteriales bacterium]
MFQDRLQTVLVPAIQQAFQQLSSSALEAKALTFQPTRPEFEGDVTINVFPFSRPASSVGSKTATAIGEHPKANVAIVDRFNAIKGFLNIVIADRYWMDFP